MLNNLEKFTHENLHNEDKSLIKLIVLEIGKQNYNCFIEIVKENYKIAETLGYKNDTPVYDLTIKKPTDFLNSVEHGPKKYIDDFDTCLFNGMSFEGCAYYNSYTYYNISNRKKILNCEDLIEQNIVIRTIDRNFINYDNNKEKEEIINDLVLNDVKSFVSKLSISPIIFEIVGLCALGRMKYNGIDSKNLGLLENNLYEPAMYFDGEKKRNLVCLGENKKSRVYYDINPILNIVDEFIKDKTDEEILEQAILLEDNILDITTCSFEENETKKLLFENN